MNFIAESENFYISDKGRLYKSFRKKPGSAVQYINMGTVRPESNAPINAIEMIKFRELRPCDLREIADLVDQYTTLVYGSDAPEFVSREVGITGS